MIHSRAALQQASATPFDVVIVGGGITGAGIAAAAAKLGFRVALIEQHDFASGCSSRSSKLVHGGLRYLQYGKLGLTALSLRERDRLFNDYPQLTQRLRFFLPFAQRAPLTLRAGIGLYDLLSQQQTRRCDDQENLRAHLPILDPQWRGALSYVDGQTDDVQLVLQTINEARCYGALACNYVEAKELVRANDKVAGVVVHDKVSQQTFTLMANVVINATGAWATSWLNSSSLTSLKKIRLKPLRGSHLVLPFFRVPLTQAVALMHPVDRRPLFALPWGGEVIFGTTDVLHNESLQQEPRISADEVDYLVDGLQRLFPTLNLDERDVLSTFAGVRPTVDDGHRAASAVSREYCVAEQNGFITIAGGKLTTFRHLAQQITRRIVRQLGAPKNTPSKTQYALRFSVARDPQQGLHHDVVHLEDWMLRRTHLGLMTEKGGAEMLNQWRQTICTTLHWDEVIWQRECARYQSVYQKAYALPTR